jgi:hypothetical protein
MWTLESGELRIRDTRERLFSTTVELMSLVTLGLRPSVHAAAKSMQLLMLNPSTRRGFVALD